MILGLDHLAINVADLNRAIEAMQRNGYSLEFHEDQLLNHPQKAAFLHQMCPAHSIALLKPPRPGLIAVELTQHASAHPIESPGLLPRWSCHDAVNAEQTSDGRAYGRWEPELTPSYLTRSQDPVIEIQRVCVLSDQIETETEFWLKAIGMKWVETSDSDAQALSSTFKVLRRVSPIPAWSFEIELHAASQVSRGHLDDQAATCLALLVTDAQRDLDKLLAAGGRDASEVFSLTVNEQPLRIALLRSPSGHCVELIEQPKRAR